MRLRLRQQVANRALLPAPFAAERQHVLSADNIQGKARKPALCMCPIAPYNTAPGPSLALAPASILAYRAPYRTLRL
jgi:hypothetical protein